MSQLHAEPVAKHRPPVSGVALGVVAVVLAFFALVIAIGAAGRDDRLSDLQALSATVNQLRARVTTMENAPGAPVNVKALSDLVSRHINSHPSAPHQHAATTPTQAPVRAKPQSPPPTKPQPATPQPIRDPDGGSLELAGVRLALEVFGFTFKSSPLLDGTPREVGTKSTTIVELFGSKYISEMAVVGVASDDPDGEANTTILVGMGAILGASTTWGTEWFNTTMKGLLRRVEQVHSKETATKTRDGVTVVLTVNPQNSIFSLTVMPTG